MDIVSLICLWGLIAIFSLRELALVPRNHTITAIFKVFIFFALSLVASCLNGYHLATSIDEGGYIGAFGIVSLQDTEEITHLLWFSLYGTLAMMIIGGAMAERHKLVPLSIFAILFCGIILPIAFSWTQGGGWLAQTGMIDRTGFGVMSLTSVAAAIPAVWLLGRRLQTRGTQTKSAKRNRSGNHRFYALALIVMMIAIPLFWGVGVRGVDLTSFDNAIAILFRLVLAAAASIITTVVASLFLFRSIDRIALLNSIVCALIAISPSPGAGAYWQIAVIGVSAGIIVTAMPTLLKRVSIDDAIGAIPAHGICAAWGLLATAWTDPGTTLVTQAFGVSAIILFTGLLSLCLWFSLQQAFGLRLNAKQEIVGQDHILFSANSE